MADEINFFTDASGAEDLGFGCVFNDKWSCGRWEKGFVKKNKPSIEFLELYAVAVANRSVEKIPAITTLFQRIKLSGGTILS